MRRPGSRVKRGHSFGLHKHDRCSCFDLRRNCCFVCRYNGTDRAGLDPKALLARKPERPVLHRCQCGAARECWNCNRSRVANRNGAWLFQIVHMKLAVSARGVAGVERVLQVVKVHVRTRALRSLHPSPTLRGAGRPPGARWSMLHSPSWCEATARSCPRQSGHLATQNAPTHRGRC